MAAHKGKLSRILRKKRKRMLIAYDAADLHRLRITLRRIRSILKQLPGRQSARLRRDLGRLAAMTNDARDWDTLFKYAQETLTYKQFGYLRPWLEVRRETAHQQVIGMLQSQRWQQASALWRAQEHAAKKRYSAPATGRQEFARAVRKVSSASSMALALDDDRRWHKLRIRIKELRYTLDILGKRSSVQEKKAVLAYCKRLQNELGDWHDTVIHQQLLGIFPATAQGDVDKKAAAAVGILQEALEARGLRCLAVSREILADPLPVA